MAVKTASEMTYTVSSGALNSTPTNQFENVYTRVEFDVQSLETDGAQAAKAFTVYNETFLFVANGGSVGRYETKSRLYKVLLDGTVTVVC